MEEESLLWIVFLVVFIAVLSFLVFNYTTIGRASLASTKGDLMLISEDVLSRIGGG